MADDLDAFLDEIDTLEAGDGTTAEAGGASSSSHPPALLAALHTKTPTAAVISMPPVKAAEPTRTVYASKPVRNEAPKPQVPSELEAGPPAAASRAPLGGGGGGPAPPAMPPQMFSPPSAPQIPPPPVHHQPPPAVPMPHMLPQAGGAAESDPEAEKKRKVMRMGGDKIWKDDSLADWPEDDYRLFLRQSWQ
mmetsp:Transcript_17123/g.39471  ORF Transcript_17123/g.39471 Transcript_17123/m.39471 type:complete len:192 (+) Transcript_17123:180-755(+)